MLEKLHNILCAMPCVAVLQYIIFYLRKTSQMYDKKYIPYLAGIAC